MINQETESHSTKMVTPKILTLDLENLNTIEAKATEAVSLFGRVDVLINNAANDPKPTVGGDNWSRFENFSEKNWEKDIAVGLTGAFLCSKIIGSYMAKSNNGVILNIASDLGVIAPDQRLYHKDGTLEDKQPVKPVTYSVIKHGLIGLTKYLATYWANKRIRVNSISPGGVYTNQDPEFVQRLSNLVPLGRMAHVSHTSHKND